MCARVSVRASVWERVCVQTRDSPAGQTLGGQATCEKAISCALGHGLSLRLGLATPPPDGPQMSRDFQLLRLLHQALRPLPKAIPSR